MADDADDAAGAGGGGGDAKALTPTQLLEYIKKQKLKLKKLERDKELLTKQVADSHDAVAAANAAAAAANDAAAAASAALSHSAAVVTTLTSADALPPTDRVLLWGVLDVDTFPHQRRLAVAALRSFSSICDRNMIRPLTRRFVFDRWRIRMLEMRADVATKEAAEAKVALAALEQKTTKLKQLLARTHQANKRFEEDSTSFKRSQRDSALQLKAMRERDDGERAQLLETVRVRTIESAFQQDMELAIQRAAESMIKSSADGPTDLAPTGKLASLVEENERLTAQLAEANSTAAAAQAAAVTSQAQLSRAERELSQLKHAMEKAVAAAAALEGQAAEGQRLRHDMELELELLTKGRADMIRGVEAAMVEKSAQQIAELKAEVAALRAATTAKGLLPAANSTATAPGKGKEPGGNRAAHAAARAGDDPPGAPQMTSSFLSLGGGLITPGLVFARKGAPAGTMTAMLDVDGWDGVVGQPSPSPLSSSSSSSTAATAAATTTYLCESLIIRARDDFRLVVPLPAAGNGSFRLSWDFTVGLPQPRTAGDQRSRVVDIGFSVMEKLSTGSLPQLLPYSRVKSPGARSTIVLGASACTTVTGPDDAPTPFSRSLILLFDNSYSWISSKEIRYTITVETLS